jgi:hypothetical protein
MPEAVSVQKVTLYDIYAVYSKFKCNRNMIHINKNDYEGTYNIVDVSNCTVRANLTIL